MVMAAWASMMAFKMERSGQICELANGSDLEGKGKGGIQGDSQCCLRNWVNGDDIS